MENYETKVQELIDMMVADYERYVGDREMPSPSYYIDSGRNYDRIVYVNGYNQSEAVAGFICRKDNLKKGFVKGDMLMAASWKAPATNFARGNIFDENLEGSQIRWTGIC